MAGKPAITFLSLFSPSCRLLTTATSTVYMYESIDETALYRERLATAESVTESQLQRDDAYFPAIIASANPAYTSNTDATVVDVRMEENIYYQPAESDLKNIIL